MFQIAQDFDLGAIVLGDIAKYWRGAAPVSDAQTGLNDPSTVKLLLAHKADMNAAYLEAEKVAIAAKAITTDDGKTTTDPGFLEAKKRITELYALPELQPGGAARADARGADARSADARSADARRRCGWRRTLKSALLEPRDVEGR